jgi:hypothetical protein
MLCDSCFKIRVISSFSSYSRLLSSREYLSVASGSISDTPGFRAAHYRTFDLAPIHGQYGEYDGSAQSFPNLEQDSPRRYVGVSATPKLWFTLPRTLFISRRVSSSCGEALSLISIYPRFLQ